MCHDLPHAPRYLNTLRLLGARAERSSQKLKFQFGYMDMRVQKTVGLHNRSEGLRAKTEFVFAALANNRFAQPVRAPRIDSAPTISSTENTEKTVMLTSQRLAISGTGAANGK